MVQLFFGKSKVSQMAGSYSETTIPRQESKKLEPVRWIPVDTVW